MIKELIVAIKAGDIKTVQEICAKKININKNHGYSRLPLDYVYELAESDLNAAKEIVTILILNGLDPLTYYNQQNRFPITRFIRKHFDSITYQLLMKVKEDLDKENQKIGDIDLSNSNEKIIPFAFYVARYGNQGSIDVLFTVFGSKYLLNTRFEDKSLCLYAIANGAFDNAFYLLEKYKFDVNERVPDNNENSSESDDESKLEVNDESESESEVNDELDNSSSESGSEELSDFDSDDEPNDEIKFGDDAGKSVFHLLLEHNNKEVTERFISEFKPDLSYKDEDGSSYVHYIAEKGLHNLINLFLEKNYGNLNDTDNSSNTPLHTALKHLIVLKDELVDSSDDDSDDDSVKKNITHYRAIEDEARCRYIIAAIEKMLLRGCAVDLENNKGETPLLLVEELQCKNLSRIFKKHSQIKSMEDRFNEILSKYRECDQELADVIEPLAEYIKERYKTNVGLRSYIADNLLIEILMMLEAKKILNYDLVEIYEMAVKLKKHNDTFQVEIVERFDNQYLKLENASDYCYTFLDGELYRLTRKSDNEETTIYKVITTLTYEGMHEGWNSESCQLHHRLVTKLDQKFESYELGKFKETKAESKKKSKEEKKETKETKEDKTYCQYIQKVEEQEGDYFGECLSENSDVDEEKLQKTYPHRKRMLTYNYYKEIFDKSQHQKLIDNRTKDKKLKKPELKNDFNLGYDRSERQKIMRTKPPSDKAMRDLNTLNRLAWTNSLDEKSLKTINTKFYVAQYRGINHKINEFGKSARMSHRKVQEEKEPLFSRAVLKAGGYKNFKDYFLKKQNSESNVVDEKLSNIAKNTQDQMLQLKKSGKVKFKVFKTLPPVYFENALHALQNLYTVNYDQFHGMLKAYVKKYVSSKDALNIESPEDAIALSINNSFNPWVSTSDTPEHALRYAYGDKYYEGNGNTRLRPRWKKNGRPERPYSGKVYISLHEPLELIEKSHHVPSLVAQGKLGVDIMTNAERETSFFAYIPKDKVVSQHIAKYPSFQHEYKEIYLEKYGLDESLYNKFKEEMKLTKPHTIERERITRLLAAHIISFHEICLIEEARIAAEKKEGVLIYRDENGGFSFLPCKTVENEKNDASKEKNLETSTLKTLRVSSSGTNGFLPKLMTEYHILPLKKHNTEIDNVAPTLIGALDVLELSEKKQKKVPFDGTKEQKITETQLLTRKKEKDLAKHFLNNYHYLMCVAQYFKVKIIIHSPEIVEKYSIIKGSENFEKNIHIYYLGGNKFSALKQKEPAQSSKVVAEQASSNTVVEDDDDIDMSVASESTASVVEQKGNKPAASFKKSEASGSNSGSALGLFSKPKSKGEKRARSAQSVSDIDTPLQGNSKKQKLSHVASAE